MNNVHFPTLHDAEHAIAKMELFAWSDRPYDFETHVLHTLTIARLKTVKDVLPLKPGQVDRIAELEMRWKLKRDALADPPAEPKVGYMWEAHSAEPTLTLDQIREMVRRAYAAGCEAIEYHEADCQDEMDAIMRDVMPTMGRTS